MKINDLSKSLGVTNKELITFLKEKGYKVSSHQQNASDEMVSDATEKFGSDSEDKASVEINVSKTIVETQSKPAYQPKLFNPDDQIACRSVTPWELIALGADKTTVYTWKNYGAVEYVRFKDLQYLRSTNYVKQPKFIIEDPDLCYQWRRDLGDTYKFYLGVEYPEDFFDKTDAEFEELLKKSTDTIKETIKVTAINMIRNENYPSIQKINLIDNIFGTCLKDFI